MNPRRRFIAIGLTLAGFGRRAWAFRLRPLPPQAAGQPIRYAPLTNPVRVPLESVATPWRPVPFVAESMTPSTPAAPAPRRVLISGVLFRKGADLSALCVTCPHEQCQVDLVTDEVRLAGMMAGAPAPNPLFECGCHSSVFDAAHDGARLSGEAPRGLYRFRIEAIRQDVAEITEIEEAALFEV